MKGIKTSIITITCWLSLSTASIAQQIVTTTQESNDSLSTMLNERQLRDSIIKYAEKYLGRPYHRGGKGPKQFDCSGFTSYVYKHFGYTLSASSSAQYKEWPLIEKSEIQKGDLLFFKGRNAQEKRVGHVALVCDVDTINQSIKFIHAAVKGGVRYDTYPASEYYKKRYVGAGRVIEHHQTTNDNLILADTVATIIKSDTTKVDTIIPSTEPPKEETIKEDSTLTHTIKKGETLYQIAKRYNIDLKKLKADNDLKSNKLKIGQKLIIIKKGRE